MGQQPADDREKTNVCKAKIVNYEGSGTCHTDMHMHMFTFHNCTCHSQNCSVSVCLICRYVPCVMVMKAVWQTSINLQYQFWKMNRNGWLLPGSYNCLAYLPIWMWKVFIKGYPPNEGKPSSTLPSNINTFPKFLFCYRCHNGPIKRAKRYILSPIYQSNLVWKSRVRIPAVVLKFCLFHGRD